MADIRGAINRSLDRSASIEKVAIDGMDRDRDRDRGRDGAHSAEAYLLISSRRDCFWVLALCVYMGECNGRRQITLIYLLNQYWIDLALQLSDRSMGNIIIKDYRDDI